MFLAQLIMFSLKASMEIMAPNPHCQGQSWSLSVNQTIDNYKKISTYIITSHFLLLIYATCNWFLLPFSYWRFSTTIKSNLLLIEDCDQFIDHKTNLVVVLCVLCAVYCIWCVLLFSELFCIWSLCLFLVLHVNVKHF